MTEHNEEKKDLIGSAKEFMNGVLSPLKGRDVGQMVEEFTSEMTLVAEGLSEDQKALADRTDKLSAQQTELEESLLGRIHDLDADLRELQDRIKAAENRISKAEHAQQSKDKKREGLHGILRQCTVLAAILAGAWVIVTLINFFK